MRTSPTRSTSSRRRLAAAAVAAALVAAAAGSAQAGEVTVTRVGTDVFVRGGADDDRITLSAPGGGVLRIESADAGTTVEGDAAAEVTLRPRDVVYLLLDGGTNAVTVDGLPRLRRLAQIGGSGADTLALGAGDLPADVLFIGQGGTDRVALAAGARVGGGVVAVMGEGADTFEATQADVARSVVVDLGAGETNACTLDRTTVGVGLALIGGDGLDTVSVVGGGVERLAQIDLGAARDALTLGGGVAFGGNVRVDAGDGDDVVVVGGDARFARAVRFDLGRGDDDGAFGAAAYEGGVRIAGDDGDDEIALAQFSAAGRLIVSAGVGNDVVTVTERFSLGAGGGLLDGGAGRDTVNGADATGARVVRFEAGD